MKYLFGKVFLFVAVFFKEQSIPTDSILRVWYVFFSRVDHFEPARYIFYWIGQEALKDIC